VASIELDPDAEELDDGPVVVGMLEASDEF